MASDAKYKSIHVEGFKILTAQQMLHRLPIALTQAKAGNVSKNSLNEIRQVIYSLYEKKCTKINKKIYNNVSSSVKL